MNFVLFRPMVHAALPPLKRGAAPLVLPQVSSRSIGAASGGHSRKVSACSGRGAPPHVRWSPDNPLSPGTAACHYPAERCAKGSAHDLLHLTAHTDRGDAGGPCPQDTAGANEEVPGIGIFGVS